LRGIADLMSAHFEVRIDEGFDEPSLACAFRLALNRAPNRIDLIGQIGDGNLGGDAGFIGRACNYRFIQSLVPDR
jgi:hypothetical protein